MNVPDGKGPLGVVGEHSAVFHRHQEVAVLLLHLHWPVLITLPLRKHVTNTSKKCVYYNYNPDRIQTK